MLPLRLQKILTTYPTSAKLYRTMVSNALDANDGLCETIASTVRNAIPPNQRQRLGDHFEAIGNHMGERRDEEGYVHGHRHKHHDRHHYGMRDHDHVPHEHDPLTGHHYGEHKHRHGQGHRHHHHHDTVQEAYPRHETHLTNEEATQAQIRSYVASGLVPPRFESFADLAVKDRTPAVKAGAPVAKVGAPVAKVGAPVAKVGTPVSVPKVTPAAIPNVTREAPSLEPPTNRVALGAPVKDFLTPPPLETVRQPKATGGIKSREVPSSEVISVAQQRKPQAAVSPVAARAPMWAAEAPSMELFTPKAAPVASPVAVPTATKRSQGPPPIEYVGAPHPAPSSSSSLPSLAQMLAKAGASDAERVH